MATVNLHFTDLKASLNGLELQHDMLVEKVQ